MQIKVNRRKITLFEGARAQHAVLRYLVARKLPPALAHEAVITDEEGHTLDADAPLSDGQTIKVKIETIKVKREKIENKNQQK
ncbi:MAG: hypothetical protein K5764_00440 [Prevotella sp.]|nr:hypothetical protein [Prevotella sp.]